VDLVDPLGLHGAFSRVFMAFSLLSRMTRNLCAENSQLSILDAIAGIIPLPVLPYKHGDNGGDLPGDAMLQTSPFHSVPLELHPLFLNFELYPWSTIPMFVGVDLTFHKLH
jgi:hypothetical protein